jgi:RNA polymerase-binding protein DksA
MNDADREEFRQRLLDLGRRLQGDFSSLANETLREAGGGPSGNLSNTPMHLADLGTDTFEQEMTLSLMENEGQTLEEISAALDRIRAGTFGQCESCGKEIVRDRLKAIPYTRLCIDCARQADTAAPTSNL